MPDGIVFGYLGINEVHPPDEMVRLGVTAERSGWDTVWLSDHFHPWSHAGTNCNFCWVVLTAVAERTKRVKIGPGVTVPGQRYHPAIIAQAFATLGAIYPGRIVLGIGSGEAVNEAAVGSDWPPASERLQWFEEGLRVMRMLSEGEFVTFSGRRFKLSTAKLYTKPKERVPIYVSTTGPKSARIAGRYADGIIIPQPMGSPALLNERILPAVRLGAKEMGRNPDAIKIAFMVLVSYDENRDKALHGWQREYWNHSLIPNVFNTSTSDPRVIQKMCKSVSDQQFLESWVVETTPEAHIKRLESYVRMGVHELMLLSASPDEEKFVRVFGKDVLPHLRDL